MDFKNEEHGDSVLSSLKLMLAQKQLVDVVLKIGTRRIPCHKNILATMCPYFHAMFTTPLSTHEENEIELFEVESEAVTLLVKYAYTGNLRITAQNAQGLLAAASLFQIPLVQKACANFMATELDIENCIGIHSVAQLYNCVDVREKSFEFICKHFNAVAKGEEFLLLTSEKLQDVISSNELNVYREEDVFDALWRWVKHDEMSRVDYLSVLLPCIRFGLLPPKYIHTQITCNEIIKRNPLCQPLLQDIRDFESNPDTYQGLHNFYVILRSGMIKPEFCFLIVGGITQNRPDINCYNPVTRETYFMADLKGRFDEVYYDVEEPACCVTEDNDIYVAGGAYVAHDISSASDDSVEDFQEETMSKMLCLYDNDHDAWVNKASMLFPKSNFALAYVEGKLYCFGGLTLNRQPTEIIECYSIAENRWSYEGMMPTPLVDLRTVVIAARIYVLGGRTGVGAHNNVYEYNPSTKQWYSLSGMPTPRFKFGVCAVGNEIYVAGGQIYSQRGHTIKRESLNSVEIYSIEKNQWRLGPELPEEMYNVGLLKLGSSLYAFGTVEIQRSRCPVNRFNVVYKYELGCRTGEWVLQEHDLCELVRDYTCTAARIHVRKLSQVFRPDVDT